MKKFILFVFTLTVIKQGNCQITSGINYYNNLQYNAAWCGQDGKHTVQAGGFFDVSEFNSHGSGYTRPQYYQAAYAADIQKIHSGAGIFLTYTTAGFERLTTVSGIYNYHVKINEHSDFRIGTQVDIAFRKEPYYNYFGPGELSSRTQTSLLLNPGLWYSNSGFNVGFSVKNVLAADNYERDFHFTMFSDSAGVKGFRVIPVMNFNIYAYREDYVYEINPQLNFEIADAVIFNGGWSHLFNTSDSGDYYTAGIGFIATKKIRFLFNYVHIKDSDNAYLSAFLKVGF